MKIQHFIRD